MSYLTDVFLLFVSNVVKDYVSNLYFKRLTQLSSILVLHLAHKHFHDKFLFSVYSLLQQQAHSSFNMSSDNPGDRILEDLLKTLQMSLQYGDPGMSM